MASHGSGRSAGQKSSPAMAKLFVAVKASSTIAQGDVTRDISLTDADATISEWCYDSQVVFHPLKLGMHIAEMKVKVLVDYTLRKARMTVQFLEKLDPNALQGNTESVTDAVMDPDLQRAITVFGGQDRLIAFVKDIYDCAMILDLREPAFVPNEAEWRYKCWDYMLIHLVMLFSRSTPLPEDRQEPPSAEARKTEFMQEQKVNYHRMLALDVWKNGQKGSKGNHSLKHYQDTLSAHLSILQDPSSNQDSVQKNAISLGMKQVEGILQDLQVKQSISEENSIKRLGVYPDGGIADAVWAYKDTSYWEMLASHLKPAKAREIVQLTEWACSHSNARGPLPLLFPLLIMESKKAHPGSTKPDQAQKKQKSTVTSDPEKVGRNQRLMYSISAARFMSELGITGLPIHGLSTTGPKGTLCFTWASESTKQSKNTGTGLGPYNIAFDDQSPDFQYDLRKKVDIVQFVAFIFKLQATHNALKQAVEDAKETMQALASRLHDNKNESWHLSTQVKQYQIPRLTKAEATRLQTEADEKARKEAEQQAEKKAKPGTVTSSQQGDETKQKKK